MPKTLKQLTPAERDQVAEKVPMDPGSLRNIIAKRRRASALTAILIERVSHKLGFTGVRREQLCDGCAKCEFAKQARGGK